MMKRLISLLLITILLITSFSFSSSADTSTSMYNKEDAELLYALGVTESASLTGLPVTRAQFVRYAMKLAGIPLTPYKGTEFADVPKTHVDYSYIMSAVDFGIISIAENFRPKDTIAPTEAFKIMVELLGYDFMAETKGGYPSGYMQTAQTIELADGVDISNNAMTEYDVCTLLCNALTVRLPEVSYTNEGASQYRVGTATILSQYRGIVEVNGVVDGVSHYSEHNMSGLGDKNISINGVTYYAGELNCDSLFGYDVVAYYDTQSKKLISCTPSDSNRIISVYAEDIESFENGTYVYSDMDAKTRSVSIGIDSTIFYNGRIFDYDSLKMIPESGSLTFVSPNGSGVYSTLYITSYRTIVVKTMSLADGYLIVDKYSNDNKLFIDPDKTEVIITDQDGEELSFSSIAVGDVVNAAISADGKYVEIICVKDEFLGTYSGYNSDYIEVDGSQYRLTSELKVKISDIITLGKQAIFRLDIDHRIADIVPSTGVGEDIGYLIVGRLFENGLSTRFVARILKLDGNIYDYDFAKSFSVNGKTYKDYKVAYNSLKSSNYNSIVCGVVKFTIDSDGKLKSIVYPDNHGGNGGLYVTNTVEESTKYHKFSRWFYCIGRDIICDTDLKVFKVPNPAYSVDSIIDEQYAVVEPGFITNDTAAGYKLEGYTTLADDGMSKYLLMQKIADDNSVENAVVGNDPYMVSKIKKALVNDEEREVLELCNDSYPSSNPLIVYSKNENDFSVEGVSPGDIIRISHNENNIVNVFKYVYKNGDSTLADGSYVIESSNTVVNELYIAMAVPYRIRSSVLDVVSSAVNLESVTQTDIKPRYVPQATILKYDERSKSVVEVSANEIKDYLTFANEKNTIVYHMSNEALLSIFIVD